MSADRKRRSRTCALTAEIAECERMIAAALTQSRKRHGVPRRTEPARSKTHLSSRMTRWDLEATGNHTARSLPSLP